MQVNESVLSEVRREAYFHWTRRDCPDGDDLKDWFAAEPYVHCLKNLRHNGTPLYNLSLGKEPWPVELGSRRIGPFSLCLVPDYHDKISLLHRARRVTESIRIQGKQLRRETRVEEPIEGQWVNTAHVGVSDEPVSSILGIGFQTDGGLYDLCEILTFLTGRRVTIGTQRYRYRPTTAQSAACSPFETLEAAELAWHRREQLVKRKLNFALLLYNLAFDSRELQSLSAHYNTALNIICDHWEYPEDNDLTDEQREELKLEVEKSVRSCPALSGEQRDTYSALLASKIEGGRNSATDKLFLLLKTLGLVGDNPTSEQKKRVKQINSIRNGLTHGGKMRHLAGLDRSQSARLTFAVVSSVLPAICRLAIGRALGFSEQSVGSLCQHPGDMLEFLSKGTWRGWPIEHMEYREWLRSRLPFSHLADDDGDDVGQS